MEMSAYGLSRLPEEKEGERGGERMDDNWGTICPVFVSSTRGTDFSERTEALYSRSPSQTPT